MTLTLDFGTRVPTIEITLGMRLQAARKLANITQDEMGLMLGCTRRTVSRWETDQTAPPAVLLAYAVATDVNLGWLKTGKASSETNEAFTDEAFVHPPGLEPGTHWLRVSSVDDVLAIWAAEDVLAGVL